MNWFNPPSHLQWVLTQVWESLFKIHSGRWGWFVEFCLQGNITVDHSVVEIFWIRFLFSCNHVHLVTFLLHPLQFQSLCFIVEKWFSWKFDKFSLTNLYSILFISHWGRKLKSFGNENPLGILPVWFWHWEIHICCLPIPSIWAWQPNRNSYGLKALGKIS